MKWWAALLLVLLVPSVFAQTFIDASTGKEITSGFVRVQTVTTIQDYYFSNETLILQNVSNAIVLLRQGKSDTFEYAARISQMPQTIIMYPAGLLQGEVKDAKEDFVIGAAVHIACPTATVDTTTDEAGQFREFLPTEKCTVSAVKNERGEAEVAIAQGKVTDTTIVLNQGIAGASYWPLLLIPLIIIGIYAWMRRPKHHGKIEEVRHVLKEKEKIIVDALIARKGKSTLAELRSATHIPRTSLLRTIESLESRNVLLKKEEHGKVIIELLGKFG